MSSLTAEKFLDLDPTMIREIATGLEEPVDIAIRYGFSKEEFKDLARMPEFRAEVSRIQSEMQRSGQTFKLMAGEMAHKLLEDMFQHSLGGETPVRDKAAALQPGQVLMLENAVYSVITPDGCASIIWKDAGRVQDAAECLHITAEDMVTFGVAEGIIREDFGAFDRMCGQMRTLLSRDLGVLCARPVKRLLAERYRRFRRIGIYEESEAIEH